MNKSYRFKRGYRAPKGADPVAVGAEVQKIQDDCGTFDVDVAVTRARNKRSPLHRFCDWNDKSAAHEYRREQMRRMARSLLVVTVDDEGYIQDEVQALHFVDTDDVRGYRSIDAVLDEPAEFEYVLKRARSMIEAAKAKLTAIQNARKVLAALDVALSELEAVE